MSTDVNPGDYSEQQLLDCGYAKNGAAGCNGAWPHSYIKTVVDEQMDLAAEVNFDKLIHSKFFYKLKTMATATDCVRSKNKLLKGDLPLQEHKPLTDLSQSHVGALQPRSQGKHYQ